MAVFLHVLTNRKERRFFLQDVLRYFLPLLVIFISLDFYTRGELYLHLVPYTFAPFNGEQFKRLSFVLLHQIPFLTLASFLLFPFVFRSTESKKTVILYYFIFSVSSLVSLARLGANENYFLEPILSMILFTFVAVDSLQSSGHGIVMRTGIFLLSCQLIWNVLGLLEGETLYSKKQDIYAIQHSAERQKLDLLVKMTRGDILSEELSVLVKNHKRVFMDPFVFISFAQRGLWSPGILINDCKNQKFALIISGGRLEQIPGISSCLEQKYVWSDRIDNFDIYRPKTVLKH